MALNALDGLALLVNDAGHGSIEDVEFGGVGFVVFLFEVEKGPDEAVFDGIDDGAVEHLFFELLSFGVFPAAKHDRKRFTGLLRSSGGGFEAGVEAG